MTTQDVLSIPLRILVCDKGDSARELCEALLRQTSILQVDVIGSVRAAADCLLVEGGEPPDVNTIFIDPFALGLDEASSFIFRVRAQLPEIVFVLYVDRVAVEKQRAQFYRGERHRFTHYYVLDKQTPIALFGDELRVVLDTCRSDLSWRMSTSTLERLRVEAERLTAATSDHSIQQILTDLQGVLRQLSTAGPGFPVRAQAATARANTVFLSHRFSEHEYVDGLLSLLTDDGFDVVTGQAADTYISRAILDRIAACEYFVCLMTRSEEKTDGTYTTSSWLIEEKGAAIALGKRIVLMVEEGVTDIGGLQGDWQRIHFAPKGFLKAALDAVKQLKQYAGG